MGRSEHEVKESFRVTRVCDRGPAAIEVQLADGTSSASFVVPKELAPVYYVGRNVMVTLEPNEGEGIST